jgi:hypothetical protein
MRMTSQAHVAQRVSMFGPSPPQRLLCSGMGWGHQTPCWAALNQKCLGARSWERPSVRHAPNPFWGHSWRCSYVFDTLIITTPLYTRIGKALILVCLQDLHRLLNLLVYVRIKALGSCLIPNTFQLVADEEIFRAKQFGEFCSILQNWIES